jgi:hypothetical protein
MPKKRLGAEQIVTKLRQIEVLQGQPRAGSGVQGGRHDRAELLPIPKGIRWPWC